MGLFDSRPWLRTSHTSEEDERNHRIAKAFENTPARPYDDADQLDAVANWLDRVDAAAGNDEHSIQDDLRRIARKLRATPIAYITNINNL